MAHFLNMSHRNQLEQDIVFSFMCGHTENEQLLGIFTLLYKCVFCFYDFQHIWGLQDPIIDSHVSPKFQECIRDPI